MNRMTKFHTCSFWYAITTFVDSDDLALTIWETGNWSGNFIDFDFSNQYLELVRK